MIAVIVLNWNNAPDTLECLDSVYASQDPSYSVYVADNASTDSSLSAIQAAYPQATYLEMKENLGFAEGNNRGIRRAMADGAEYLFLLNNDAVVAKDTLAVFRQAAKRHPKAGAIGSAIYYYDDPATLWFSKTQWLKREGVHVSASRNLDQPAPTSFVSGCALFIRGSVVKTVGLMDPRFFLNFEEIDWCYQMRRCGFESLYVPGARVWHKVTKSFIGGKQGTMWWYFYGRNQLLWMEKNLSKQECLRLILQIFVPNILFVLQFAFKKDRRGMRIRAYLRGVWDYLTRRFGPGPSYLLKPPSNKNP